MIATTQFTQQPGLRPIPVTFDRFRRDVQNFGRLSHGEPTEKTKFDHFGRPFIGFRQLDQGVIQGHQIGIQFDYTDPKTVTEKKEELIRFTGEKGIFVKQK